MKCRIHECGAISFILTPASLPPPCTTHARYTPNMTGTKWQEFGLVATPQGESGESDYCKVCTRMCVVHAYNIIIMVVFEVINYHPNFPSLVQIFFLSILQRSAVDRYRPRTVPSKAKAPSAVVRTCTVRSWLPCQSTTMTRPPRLPLATCRPNRMMAGQRLAHGSASMTGTPFRPSHST